MIKKKKLYGPKSQKVYVYNRVCILPSKKKTKRQGELDRLKEK